MPKASLKAKPFKPTGPLAGRLSKLPFSGTLIGGFRRIGIMSFEAQLVVIRDGEEVHRFWVTLAEAVRRFRKDGRCLVADESAQQDAAGHREYMRLYDAKQRARQTGD